MTKSSKVVLVLGASSDIGQELLRSLDDGETVLLAHCHRGIDKLNAIRAELQSPLFVIAADLSTEVGVEQLLTQITAAYGAPNQIIHLPASKFGFTRFKDQKWESYQAEIDLQLKSIILILKKYMPAMVRNREGRIVLMLSSVCVGVPPKALNSYTVAKYALLGLMKSLASEYADKGITVNAISPSMIETSFLVDIPEKMIELNAAGHPLKRNATVKEVVPMIKFLLSDSASYLNGVNIPITGGSNF